MIEFDFLEVISVLFFAHTQAAVAAVSTTEPSLGKGEKGERVREWDTHGTKPDKKAATNI